mmetsp:Transcript_4436/g.28278  ORF Transcript_4436/g.28278 Transcript_4436/m.28278 type:complete len:216 (-) Transcript_4436:2607-3254(-)
MIAVSGTLPAIFRTEDQWRIPDMFVLHVPTTFYRKWSCILFWAISQSTCALEKFADLRDSVPNLFIECCAEKSIWSVLQLMRRFCAQTSMCIHYSFRKSLLNGSSISSVSIHFKLGKSSLFQSSVWKDKVNLITCSKQCVGCRIGAHVVKLRAFPSTVTIQTEWNNSFGHELQEKGTIGSPYQLFWHFPQLNFIELRHLLKNFVDDTDCCRCPWV